MPPAYPRILAVVRPNAFEHPGGDVIHAQQSCAALQRLGLPVDLVASEEPDSTGYDLAHVFGIFEPATAARQIAAIRGRGTPLALSPIWLDLRPFEALAPALEHALEARTDAGVEKRLARLRREGSRLVRRHSTTRHAERRLALQRALVAAADVLFPASEVEAYLYGERLGAGGQAIVVAPLGVDDAAFVERPVATRRGVLCAAARVEAKKNQAALLYALHDVDVDVTLLGRPHDASYLALCRRWATSRTRFVDHAPQAEVLRLMGEAAVHAHPSWFESPGLASLEAAATGMHVVTGDRGCEREYFGPDAAYADPADPASIRGAVLRALARPARTAGDGLERRLRARTWRANAEATLDGYERALAARGS